MGDALTAERPKASRKTSKAGPGGPGGGAAPPPRTRNVLIDVFADTLADGRVDFSHKWKFEDQPGNPNTPGRIDLPAGPIAYQFHFHLRDRTEPKKNLSFKRPTSEAMWVTVGSNCPGQAGNGAGQILFKHPWTRDVLIVDDLNSNVPEMDFKYALRFDGAAGEQPGTPPKICPPYEYDPDFKNGGGNT